MLQKANNIDVVFFLLFKFSLLQTLQTALFILLYFIKQPLLRFHRFPLILQFSF